MLFSIEDSTYGWAFYSEKVCMHAAYACGHVLSLSRIITYRSPTDSEHAGVTVCYHVSVWCGLWCYHVLASICLCVVILQPTPR